MTSRPDAIVVGAGFAGVAAATALAERGARVLVLETRRRPGGRAVSWSDPVTGEVRDNGQHVLGSFYDETLRLLARLGTADALEADPTFRLLVWSRGRKSLGIRCPDLPAPFHWLAALLSAEGLSIPARLTALSLSRRARALIERNGDGSSVTVQRWLEMGPGSEDLAALLWPLALAALNDRPGESSALPFARVLDRLLKSPARRTGLALPRRGLSDLIAGFEMYVTSRGGEVRYGETALGVRIESGRAAGLSLLGGRREEGGAVVLAVPHERMGWMLHPSHLDALGWRSLATLPWSPIVSALHLFDRPILPARIVAMLGTRTQWAFDRGEVHPGSFAVGTVRSAAFHDVTREIGSIAEETSSELREAFAPARAARLLSSRVYKERRATMRVTPEAERLRPEAKTPIDGLLLAGDWTRTGLPPTIEGAVWSGHKVAELVR